MLVMYYYLTFILFGFGLLGMLVHRNVFSIFMSLCLILGAMSVLFVFLGKSANNGIGGYFSFVSMVLIILITVVTSVFAYIYGIHRKTTSVEE